MDNLRGVLKNHKLWQAVLVGYWLAILVASHLPRALTTLPGNWWDKLVHFSLFAVLAVLLATTWRLAAGELTRRHLCWAWIVIVLYGAVDEYTQPFFGRDASVFDWLADGAGAAAGLALFCWFRAKSRAAAKPPLKSDFST